MSKPKDEAKKKLLATLNTMMHNQIPEVLGVLVVNALNEAHANGKEEGIKLMEEMLKEEDSD